MALACAEVVARIASGRAPVLCLDTSVVLDIVRSGYREGLDASHVEAAKRLTAAASAARLRLFVIGAEQVAREFDENVAAVVRDAERALRRTADAVAQAVDVGRAVGVRVRPVSLPGADIVASCERLARALLQTAVVLADDREVRDRAGGRVIAALAPSSRGQQSYKDCVIIEHYLELADHLRTGGFRGGVVFVSSNTRDYSDPNRRNMIHPDLHPDFQRLGMDFAVNFPMARARLGL